MFRQEFPLKSEILFSQDSLILCFEKRWGGPIKAKILDDKNKLIECKILDKSECLTEFKKLRKGCKYIIKVTFKDPIRKIKYRTFERKIIFEGKKKLKVQGVGSGRSGTKSFADWMDGLRFNDGERVKSRHESLSGKIVSLILENRFETIKKIITAFPHNVETAPYFLFLPYNIIGEKVVFLVRDGRRVVESGMKRGWYLRNTPWDRIKPDFPGDAFEQSCQLWSYSCDKLIPKGDLIIRLENLIKSKDERNRLLRDLKIIETEKPFPQKTATKKAEYGFEWTVNKHKQFDKHCGSWMDTLYPGWRKKTAFLPC